MEVREPEDDYDEFEALGEAVAELGLAPDEVPPVSRRSIQVTPAQQVSVLVWGEGSPELVFLHGGGQNAHTWDLVALALGRPAIAVDLPGHGHSDRRDDHDYWPWRNAEAVQEVLAALAPAPVTVVGMSLGGLTAIRLGALRPDVVRKVVVVDVTPGVHLRSRAMTMRQRGTTALIGGAATFGSFEQMVDLAVQASPNRPAAAVRRGVLHNSRRLPDGRWTWRYDRIGRPEDGPMDFSPLWDDVASLRCPVMLVRGGLSAFVAAEDEQEFVRRLPSVRTETVPGAGHSVQSDQPWGLAHLIDDFDSSC
ncbi:alpha/beta hydrolase [Streptosporangium sp. NPDC002544]|uniref:alpha/beta fold hydrolase n=1 Tax=Streptosporangium sp. NPDC002544 TaxID=3154538 RepID=UPI0033254517